MPSSTEEHQLKPSTAVQAIVDQEAQADADCERSPCYLLKLPPELRLPIYELTFAPPPDDGSGWTNIVTALGPPNALLYTWRKVYAEAKEMHAQAQRQYWQAKNFVLDTRPREAALSGRYRIHFRSHCVSDHQHDPGEKLRLASRPPRDITKVTVLDRGRRDDEIAVMTLQRNSWYIEHYPSILSSVPSRTFHIPMPPCRRCEGDWSAPSRSHVDQGVLGGYPKPFVDLRMPNGSVPIPVCLVFWLT